MRVFCFIVLLSHFVAPLKSFAEIAVPPIYQENRAYRIVARQYRLDHTLIIDSSPLGVKTPGFGYRLGYSLGLTSFDLGAEYMKAVWGNLSSEISAADLSGAVSGGALDQPDSELRRPRLSTDPWSIWIIEVGVSIRGRLFPNSQKNWLQYGRFSLAQAHLNDEVNSLSFTGWLMGVEGGLTYLIKDNISLSPHLTYRFGFANRSDLPTSDNSRLPLNNLQFGLGLSYLIF